MKNISLSHVTLQFDYTGDYCITGSIDRTCKLWDVHTGQCMETLRGHTDEVLLLNRKPETLNPNPPPGQCMEPLRGLSKPAHPPLAVPEWKTF